MADERRISAYDLALLQTANSYPPGIVEDTNKAMRLNETSRQLLLEAVAAKARGDHRTAADLADQILAIDDEIFRLANRNEVYWT